MKNHFLLFVFFWISSNAFCQTKSLQSEGSVSFISSQNIYVKFKSTEGVKIGDTLFVKVNGVAFAALLVKNFSSISCVCAPLTDQKFTVSLPVFGNFGLIEKQSVIVESLIPTAISVNDAAIKSAKEKVITDDTKQKISGKISFSSYSNISDFGSNHRFRYNLAMNAQHIAGSKFSTETYIMFTHKTNEWDAIRNDIFRALKIYNLSVKYQFNKTASVSFGRKININMANIGAADGLQFEKSKGQFTYGALVGSRPDYYNYSFNPDLLQAGAFVSHHIRKKSGDMQNSFAIFGQTNKLKTDRQFIYMQHSNSLVKKVDLFCSFEFDLYSMQNLKPVTSLNLSSTYLSLRYKPWQRLSLSLSYDARKNIYYYETFKNQIDSILDKETRQGLRYQFNYRPLKYLNWGGTAGYRFQKSDPVPSVNGNSYLNYSKLPWIDASITLNATYLQTVYMDGLIYGGIISRDFLDGKLSTDLEYRLVNYQFNNSSRTLQQNIAEMSLSWRIAKRLMLSTDFEFTLENENNAVRLFLNLTQRF